MLKVQLIEEKGIFSIKEYDISYPYSLLINSKNERKIYWNLNSFECENTQDSFRLFYARKLDFSGLTTIGEKRNVVDGVITNVHSVGVPRDNTTQQFFFSSRLFFYINEKNKSNNLNGNRKELPRLLIKNKTDAKKAIQFLLSYDGNRAKNILKGEKITFYLNLFDEKT